MLAECRPTQSTHTSRPHGWESGLMEPGLPSCPLPGVFSKRLLFPVSASPLPLELEKVQVQAPLFANEPTEGLREGDPYSR